jgi:hypothetical protein
MLYPVEFVGKMRSAERSTQAEIASMCLPSCISIVEWLPTHSQCDRTQRDSLVADMLPVGKLGLTTHTTICSFGPRVNDIVVKQQHPRSVQVGLTDIYIRSTVAGI